MLAAWATVEGCLLTIFVIADRRDVEIVGSPTTVQWVIVAILGIALPLAGLVGWLVSRLASSRTRAAAATVAVAFAVITDVIEAGPVQLSWAAVIVAVVLILTGCGVGSVLGWAVRMTLSHLATVGTLAVRALPIVLLTALVFLNTYVWLMAATTSGERLWLAMGFMLAIAGAFVISKTVERVRPMLASTAALPEGNESLSDTPFARMPDPSPRAPLKRTERLNVVFLLAASQLVQILVVASVTATIYVILGLIVLTPALLKEWTHTDSGTATVLGMTFSAPVSLIHMCLFLGALTFMHISARAVDDAEYRATFLDPLIDDLRTALIARSRYRANIVGTPATGVDVADLSD